VTLRPATLTTNIRVGDLSRGAGVLAAHAAGRATLLEKASFIDHQNRVIGRQVLDDIVPHDIAQCIRVAPAAAQDGLLTPRAGAAAASARIQPILRRSSPNRLSRNSPADAATRSCVNSGLIRAFTSRSDDAQSSSVVSIEAPDIHDLPKRISVLSELMGNHENYNVS
jgi:hypothetical protein